MKYSVKKLNQLLLTKITVVWLNLRAQRCILTLCTHLFGGSDVPIC